MIRLTLRVGDQVDLVADARPLSIRVSRLIIHPAGRSARLAVRAPEGWPVHRDRRTSDSLRPAPDSERAGTCCVARYRGEWLRIETPVGEVAAQIKSISPTRLIALLSIPASVTVVRRPAGTLPAHADGLARCDGGLEVSEATDSAAVPFSTTAAPRCRHE